MNSIIEFFKKNERYKVVGGVMIIVATYMAGKHSRPDSVEIKSATTQVEKIADNSVITEDIEETVKPDGSKTTKSHKTIQKNVIADRKTNTKTETVIENKHSTLNLSLLAGINPFDTKLLYGASVTKDLVGPITIGAWVLTSGALRDTSGGISFGTNLPY